jgi:carbon starvation protein
LCVKTRLRFLDSKPDSIGHCFFADADIEMGDRNLNAALVALGAIILFFLGYRFYARYLAQKIFDLDSEQGATPAHQLEDGIDYVPTKASVLFGHHYSSIAGAAPIVGPAVAVIWGWVPAMLWVIFGVIFMGACHDFGALVLSMRHKGQSIGQLTESIIGTRARSIFLLVVFFLIWIVIAVFALVIANLFKNFPESVIPVNFEIIIALLMGRFINKKKGDLKLPSLFAQVGLLCMIYLGTQFPISLAGVFGDSEIIVWIVFLLVYGLIASTLPVWILLQPRDYINGHQLFLGLGLMLLGLFISSPDIVAPAFNPQPIGAPPWFPFLFITIACGAISGFHGLVSSGTTSKQVNRWKDAKSIGYGTMLGEGLLALLATLAVTAGFKTPMAWHSHYASWNAANGLSAKISAFVLGSGGFISSLGIPESFAQTVMAVLIISFAATSLDTAVRIQRYVLGEIGESFHIAPLKNRYFASLIAVGSAFLLIVTKSGGKGGLVLWPLFGATNQLLASLTLIVISVYLFKQRKKIINFLLPCIFVYAMTCYGILLNLKNYYHQQNWMLLLIGSILFSCQIWILIEAIIIFKTYKFPPPPKN